jgi:hypothetical protein
MWQVKNDALEGCLLTCHILVSSRKCIKFVLWQILLNKTQGLAFFSQNPFGKYPKDVKFQNSEYEVHTSSWTKDYGSQNGQLDFWAYFIKEKEANLFDFFFNPSPFLSRKLNLKN